MNKLYGLIVISLITVFPPGPTSSGASLRNDRYVLDVATDGTVAIRVEGMPPQRLAPEFTVLWSETDPRCRRNASHPNHPVAPRVAVRWLDSNGALDALNSWVGSPEFRAATGLVGSVSGEGRGRVWEFRDAKGKVSVRVAGERAAGHDPAVDGQPAHGDAAHSDHDRGGPGALGIRRAAGVRDCR